LEDDEETDLAEKFGTDPELMHRTFNRIRTDQLEVRFCINYVENMNFF